MAAPRSRGLAFKKRKGYLDRYPKLDHIGGDEGDRTPDLCNAIAALSQLSYVPKINTIRKMLGGKCRFDEFLLSVFRFPLSTFYLPLKTGFRFSRNAETPSFLSSVE